MPTGYTSFIEEGKAKTAKQFLHICLFNFGITMSVRDTGVKMDTEDLEPYINEGFQKSIDYHGKELESAKQKLADILSLSDDQLYERYVAERNKFKERYQQLYEESLNKNYVYDKFLEKIKAWQPSSDFKSIKEFAINQIEISKEKDPTYWGNQADKIFIPSREEFDKFRDVILDDLTKDAKRSIQYHQEEYDRKVRGKEDALSFYRRFKAEIEELDS